MKEIRKYKTEELFGTEPDSDDDWYKSLTERKLEIEKSIKDTQNSIECLREKMDGIANGKESDSDDNANIDDIWLIEVTNEEQMDGIAEDVNIHDLL